MRTRRVGPALVAGLAAIALLAGIPAGTAAAHDPIGPVAGGPVAAPRGVAADRLALRGRVIDTATGAEPSVAADLRHADAGARELWLVQFAGPIRPEWIDGLARRGVTTVMPVPPYAYVVQGSPAAVASVRAWRSRQPVGSGGAIRWMGEYRPDYRLSPELTGAQTPEPDELVPVTVQVVGDDPAAVRAARATGVSAGTPVAVAGVVDVVMQVRGRDLETLARQPGVINVEPRPTPTMHDEAQDQLLAGNTGVVSGRLVPTGPGYLDHLAALGVSTDPSQHPIVAVIDDGVDTGTTEPAHSDLRVGGAADGASRVVYAANCTDDPSGSGIAGHGTINAGIIGGFNDSTGTAFEDAAGYQYGLGVDPFARLATIKIFKDNGWWSTDACGGGSTDQGLLEQAVASGAGITNNSWGAATEGAYTASDREWDAATRDASAAPGLQPVFHVFSAANEGPGGNTIGSPGNAKNVLTVGATENVRDEGVADGCGLADGDSAADIAIFSSRGPTDDLRAKPDIVAPGTHVQGPASQVVGYDGTGVCGAPGSPYYPAGQQRYTWSSGTSHSAPAVSGAAALASEYYTRVLAPGQQPSPAMLKALLVGSAHYLDGVDAAGTLPGTGQGWGAADLSALVDDTRWVRDQGEPFTASGQSLVTPMTVADPARPVRVTLVWSDAPGSTVGDSWVNDLDLEVTVSGQTYLGNVFVGAVSASGGTADPRNNVEQISLPAGLSGPVSITVQATNIAGDGVPGNDTLLDQDFALTTTNLVLEPDIMAVTPSSGPVLGGTPITVTGSGFHAGATVTVGGGAATVTGRTGETAISATTPAHAAGSVDVTVTNPGGPVATLSGGFTYRPPDDPTTDPPSPPTPSAPSGGPDPQSSAAPSPPAPIPTPTPTIAPGAVTGLAVRHRADGHVAVRWSRPAATGAAVTGYQLRRTRPDRPRVWRPWRSTADTRMELVRLRADARYRVQVRAMAGSTPGVVAMVRFRTSG